MIKRLSELTKDELPVLGAWMRGEIQPASISAGCTYVCQKWQKPHFWSNEYLEDLRTCERNIGLWVAWEDGPRGFTSVMRGPPRYAITLFLVDTTISLPEQVKLADRLARYAVEDMLDNPSPGVPDIIINIPLDAQGDAYADLCGFSKPKETSLQTPRVTSLKALHENILARQKHG